MCDLQPFPRRGALGAARSSTRARTAALAVTLVSMLAVWTPAVSGQGCPVTFTGATTSPSLRLMTYNAHFQVDPGCSEDQYPDDFETRAQDIAALILADNPDIVALQEVNADSIKKLFIELLQGTYPSFVEKLDENDLENDSGLMLFSKYRFDEPAGEFINFAEIDFQNQGFPAEVNGLVFSDAVGTDAWANKGAGMVHVLNECNGLSSFHVAFTHMQADHDGDSDASLAAKMEARQLQMADIKRLIETHVSLPLMPFEPVFVLGDLNYDGNLFANPPEFFMTVDSFDNVVQHPHSEWANTFDGADPTVDINDGFFACRGLVCTYPGTSAPPEGTYLTDAWAFGTSPRDPGVTSSQVFEDSPSAGTRKDYVLHNRPRRRGIDDLCMQHITRGFVPLAGAGIGGDLSDHLPVTADFNRPAPRCSPHPLSDNRPVPMMGPGEVVFNFDDPTAPNFKDVSFTDGQINFPGSLQWYVIDQAASYEIKVTGNNIGYRVYQGENLSNPMAPFNGECEEIASAGRGDGSFSCKFNMQKPPYFIQVFASATSADADGLPDRTRAGDTYTIDFHRFDCSSMDDACLLKAATEVGPYRWPVGPLDPSKSHPESNTMYFRFDTEFASDGVSPVITLQLQHDFALPPASQPDVLTMELVDSTGALVCGPPECLAGTGLASFEPESGWSDVDNDLRPDRLATAPDGKLDGEDNWTQPYYLKVIRGQPYQAQGDRVWVRYETDLTYFRPLKLVCKEERTWIGEDDIQARFGYDSLSAIIEWLGWEWDDGHKIEQAGTTGVWMREFPFSMDRSFLRFVKPEIYEDVQDGDDYLFKSPISGSQILPLDRTTVSANDAPFKAKYIYSDATDPDDADYWYEMGFQLTHERPVCRTSPTVPTDGDCTPPLTCQNGACQ